MFKRVKADPNGDVTFEYGTFAVKIDRYGVTHTKDKLFTKENYEPLDNIRDNSVSHSSDQLSKHI